VSANDTERIELQIMLYTSPIRVMLVDDYEIIRTGLRTILSREDDIDVVADIGTSQQVMEVCATVQPDVLLMDFTLDHDDGPQITCHVRKRFPTIKVIILTCMFDYWSLQAIIGADAAGYLIKNASADQIVAAVRRAYAGEPVFAPEVMRHLVYSRQGLVPHADTLTEREQDVLQLIIRGHTNKEIGLLLNLSPFTVKNHVARLLNKLGAASRAEAAAMALKRHLVHVD
jgi:two-component system, NarL family, response regulator LiaR